MLGKGLPPPRLQATRSTAATKSTAAPRDCSCSPPCTVTNPTLEELNDVWRGLRVMAIRHKFKDIESSLPDSSTLAHAERCEVATVEDENVDWASGLGDDILCIIFCRVSPRDTGAAACACRSFAAVASRDDVWRVHVQQLAMLDGPAASQQQLASQQHGPTPFDPSGHDAYYHWSITRCTMLLMLYNNHQHAQHQQQMHEQNSAVGCAGGVGVWRALYRDVTMVREVVAWDRRLSELHAALTTTELYSKEADARRRLSKLQLNDYRESQRDRNPPLREFVTAATLARALLHGWREGDAGDATNTEKSTDTSGSRDVQTQEAVSARSTQQADSDETQEAVAVAWLREALPDLGQRFGEHAQVNVAPFLDRLFTFGSARAATPPIGWKHASFETALCRAEAALPRVCFHHLEARLRDELKRCVPASGPTDNMRVLRLASAVTYWAVTSVQRLRAEQRLAELAKVQLAWPRLALPCLASPRLASPCLALPCLASHCRLALLRIDASSRRCGGTLSTGRRPSRCSSSSSLQAVTTSLMQH